MQMGAWGLQLSEFWWTEAGTNVPNSPFQSFKRLGLLRATWLVFDLKEKTGTIP